MNIDNPYDFFGSAPEEMGGSTIGILVYAESAGDKISEESLIAVGKARELADMLGTGVGAILLNSADEVLGHQFYQAGANRVFQAKDDRYQSLDTELYCQQVSHLIKNHQPEIVLTSTSQNTVDFMPRLAQQLQTGMISGCIALEIDTTERVVLATRPRYNGNLHEIHVCESARPQIILLMPATFPMPIMDELRQGEIEKI